MRDSAIYRDLDILYFCNCHGNSKKIPCEKPLLEQLEIMERYTSVHKARLGSSKEMREAACLEVLYPTLFRHIQDQDLIAGRLDFLPIGFGCVMPPPASRMS